MAAGTRQQSYSMGGTFSYVHVRPENVLPSTHHHQEYVTLTLMREHPLVCAEVQHP